MSGTFPTEDCNKEMSLDAPTYTVNLAVCPKLMHCLGEIPADASDWIQSQLLQRISKANHIEWKLDLLYSFDSYRRAGGSWDVHKFANAMLEYWYLEYLDELSEAQAYRMTQIEAEIGEG